jgi:RNA polymerase sigma-70 factor, ECF subfamily
MGTLLTEGDRPAPGSTRDRPGGSTAVPGGSVTGSAPGDEEIIRRVLAGEVDLFVELITRYQQHVGRIVAGHVRRDLVEEVSHDVFVRAYTSLSTYSRQTPFAHWLARIALRSCYDAWRSLAGRKELPLSSLGDEHQRWAERLLATESHERFEELVRQQETTELLHRALAQLSPENRMVVTLVHLEGHSVREAAERLGWSVINVKVRAHRARQQLRQILEGLMKDSP